MIDQHAIDDINKAATLMLSQEIKTVELAIVALTLSRARDLKEEVCALINPMPGLVVNIYSLSTLNPMNVRGKTRVGVIDEVDLSYEMYAIFERSTIQARAALFEAGVRDFPKHLIIRLKDTKGITPKDYRKRFMLFGSDQCFYASGGMNDFQGWFEDLEAATAFAEVPFDRPINSEFEDNEEYDQLVASGETKKQLEWWHVFDTYENRVVIQYGSAHEQDRMCENISGGTEAATAYHRNRRIVTPRGLTNA